MLLENRCNNRNNLNRFPQSHLIRQNRTRLFIPLKIKPTKSSERPSQGFTSFLRVGSQTFCHLQPIPVDLSFPFFARIRLESRLQVYLDLHMVSFSLDNWDCVSIDHEHVPHTQF